MRIDDVNDCQGLDVVDAGARRGADRRMALPATSLSPTSAACGLLTQLPSPSGAGTLLIHANGGSKRSGGRCTRDPVPHQYEDHRAYVRAILGSEFCLVIPGDTPSSRCPLHSPATDASAVAAVRRAASAPHPYPCPSAHLTSSVVITCPLLLSRRREVETTLLGCLPVLVGRGGPDQDPLPYSNQVAWDSFSLCFAHNVSARDLLRAVRAVPRVRRDAMRAALWREAPKLQLGPSPSSLGAQIAIDAICNPAERTAHRRFEAVGSDGTCRPGPGAGAL